MQFAAIAPLDDLLREAGVALAPTPRGALFLAGKAFARYRASDGAPTAVLPDVFIGAHAAVAGLPLLTRDARRNRAYTEGGAGYHGGVRGEG